ncbi:MAG: cyclic 2,3-diphosphoglycerate synthase [Nitrospinaceae bacterium]
MKRKKILIMGAAGRDFHNFNVFFRNNTGYELVAFTAAQIPGIEGKIYPPDLAGSLYPEGIPIYSEDRLLDLIRENGVDAVVFAYSDLTQESVMHKASSVLAAGSDFWLMGPHNTMIPSSKKIISICAVRTGCGKSQTARKITKLLKDRGIKVVAIRHAMPYGNLEKQKVQRFAVLEDLKSNHCTIEEMEEYEPYLEMGSVLFAGVDYEAILREAEKEADLIIWDGGNNDWPFYSPDLEIVVADPHRPGHELKYFPGEVNLKRAQVVVINKIDTADYQDVQTVRENIYRVNPQAVVIEAASPIYVDHGEKILNRRVLVVEDGPTLTHGEMKYGAGIIAAKRYGAREIIDPRPWITGTLKETFARYPNIGSLLPAMGYGEEQIRDLECTINAADCDLVIIGTPIDLKRVIHIQKPSVRVKYELQEIGSPDLESVLQPFLT